MKKLFAIGLLTLGLSASATVEVERMGCGSLIIHEDSTGLIESLKDIAFSTYNDLDEANAIAQEGDLVIRTTGSGKSLGVVQYDGIDSKRPEPFLCYSRISVEATGSLYRKQGDSLVELYNDTVTKEHCVHQFSKVEKKIESDVEGAIVDQAHKVMESILKYCSSINRR